MSNPITLEDIEQFIMGYVQTLTGHAAGVQNALKNTEDNADYALEYVVSDAVSSWGSLHELDSSAPWMDLPADTQEDLFDYVAMEIRGIDAYDMATEYVSGIIYNSEIREVFWEWESECEDILDELGREDRTIMDQMTVAVNIFDERCLEEMLGAVSDAFDADDCHKFTRNEMEVGN